MKVIQQHKPAKKPAALPKITGHDFALRVDYVDAVTGESETEHVPPHQTFIFPGGATQIYVEIGAEWDDVAARLSDTDKNRVLCVYEALACKEFSGEDAVLAIMSADHAGYYRQLKASMPEPTKPIGGDQDGNQTHGDGTTDADSTGEGSSREQEGDAVGRSFQLTEHVHERDDAGDPGTEKTDEAVDEQDGSRQERGRETQDVEPDSTTGAG